ncbi:MAG: hypothetical protein PF693_20440, partial [Spirochaetia bacterium]|nr:hypothetical protein [Spirochaetia bacterium]
MKNNYKFLFILGLLFLFLISPIISQEDFISFMDDETTTELQWSGSGSLNTRYYTDYHNPLESNVGVFPKLKLNLDYKSHRSEFHSRINLSGDPNILIQDDMSYYLKKMLDEVYFQMFFYNINFEAGYIKLIWGKGNNFFTFDNLNALDYTDFLNPSYLDRKIAEAMIKLNIPF